jgi:hypothetical protein
MNIAVGADLQEKDAWEWLKKQHPAISSWLHPFTAKGRKRGDKGEFWWELRACAYYESFDTPKINYGHFSPSPLFAFDRKGYYSTDKSYIISTADFFLLGLLTSHVHWFLITAMCPSVRGGFYEVRTYYIDILPIPKATDKQKETISTLAEGCQTLAESRYKMQDAFRRRIPDLCPADKEAKLSNKLKSWWELDFSEFQKEIKSRFKYALTLKESMEWEPLFNEGKEEIQKFNYQLASKESELNKEVYKLFKLDADDIALLEKNLK